MRLLLPKPESDWARWRDALAPLGVALHPVDPWLFDWFEETPRERQLWLNLDEFQGVICVSARAAERLLWALDRYWPMPPVRVHWLCNGPGTAGVLARGGLAPRHPARHHTAEAVLELPETQSVAEQKWLVVKGEGGRDRFGPVLTERGARVSELTVYRRQLRSQALVTLVEQSTHADAILVSSQSLAEALWRKAPEHWRRWSGAWLVGSQRLQRWAHHAGVANVWVSEGASPEAVRPAIQRHIS